MLTLSRPLIVYFKLVPDLMVTTDDAGATRVTASSDRGHVALLSTLVDVFLVVPDDQLQEFVDGFKAEGLVCARRTEARDE